MYDQYFKRRFISSDNSKLLQALMDKTNEGEISSKIFSFKSMFSENDLKAMSSLLDLMGEDIDFVQATSDQIKLYLKNLKLKEPPQTTFIMKEGNLKRDPGFMKSWKD